MPQPSQTAHPNTWSRVLDLIEGKISAHSFNTWFRPTRFLEEDARRVAVAVPNPWFADWLKANYQNLIQATLAEISSNGLAVDFEPETVDPPRAEAVRARARPAPRLPPPPAVLNPRYTFERFVVSSCNQFAHAAATAVAQQPVRSYNPLYIYGGTGLGKTHLMQAIGNRVACENRRMAYVSSEQFMNELINAIRFEKTLEFKERYRSVDVLLIDDIQFLAGKERTQEEFFHTFNALHDADRQIVITSDVPPREIPTLEERLRSRFEWGLIADIQPPDLETKVAILRKKAEAESAPLPDDVALFIGSRCTSNIRELEGALIRTIAYCSMSRREMSLELAREVLKDLLPQESPAATVESIQKLVASYYALNVSDLKTRSNSRQITFPRQIAMYMCKQLTNCSLPEIGRRFGGKHHSTVIHAIHKIEKKRGDDREFDKLVAHFMQSLQ